jgi:hypothetical protein
MGILDKLLHRHRDAATTDDEHAGSFGDAVGRYLDPLDPGKGTFGDMPDGIPGKSVGEGGATPASEGLD